MGKQPLSSNTWKTLDVLCNFVPQETTLFDKNLSLFKNKIKLLIEQKKILQN